MNRKRVFCQIILTILSLFIFMGVLPLRDSRAAETEENLSITVPFGAGIGDTILSWEFPYSDAFFREESEEFSLPLAQASMGLTVSAFRQENKESALDNQYETYLSAAGFQDIVPFGYDQDTSKETLSGVIAWKQVDDFVLVAAVPCGQGYGKEWAGNLEVGDEERHVGFNRAAQIMEGQIRSYLETHDLTGRRKLWISGFSRASAVANLTAADMIDSGLFEDVYAYLFAVPRTTKLEEAFIYKGIYNICGKSDPITQIPTQKWGYRRYGTDLFTPAPEMDSRYQEHARKADEVSRKLTGSSFQYNAEVSYQIHLILEFLNELFPTGKDYREDFQDVIMGFWTEANPDQVLLILQVAIAQLEDLDLREEYSSEVFMSYLTYLSSQYLKEDREQMENASWDRDKSIAENVFREHMPATYIDWLFSGVDLEDLFYGPELYDRIYLFGDFGVEVWKEGIWIKGIDQNGKAVVPEDTDTDDQDLRPDVFLKKNDRETVLCIPLDGRYQVRIKTDRPQNLILYDFICTPYLTYGVENQLLGFYLNAGEYEITPSQFDKETYLKVIEGDVREQYELPFRYSPTLIMSSEETAVRHVTIEDLLVLLVGVVLFVLVLLLICLIIFIIHAVRRKTGKKADPYSHWFVIVPHLILIVVFTLLTQFFTLNMFAIGKFREICAGLTMLMIFLLALRGLLKRRILRNVIIAAVLLVLSFVNFLFYQNSSLVSSSSTHFIIYCLSMSLLSLLAVSTFYSWKRHY